MEGHTMSGDGAFMYFAGRRVEWQMVHPAFQRTFAFNVHGPELCLDLNIHPQFPTAYEIDAIQRIIRKREEALV
jgi:hypothetical protein